MQIIYYAHAKGLYGSKLESQDIKTLTKLGFRVINPSEPKLSSAYSPGSGMQYWLNIVKRCDAVAFRRAENGKLSSGVGAEVLFALKEGKQIIELPNQISRKQVMSIEETHELNIKLRKNHSI